MITLIEKNIQPIFGHTYATLLGPISIICSDTALLSIHFGSTHSQTVRLGRTAMTDFVYSQLDEYFHGKRTVFDLPLYMAGTEFQKKVWMALLDIPYGETRSYGEIAAVIGNPKASRAVGMANHNNPIAIVVPCHRVIGKNGNLTGYASGLTIKQKLLSLESQTLTKSSLPDISLPPL